MAQGQQERLRGIIDYPKHFIPVVGEPIAYRTVRLIRQIARTAKIWAVCPQPSKTDFHWKSLAHYVGVELLHPTNPGLCILDGIRNTRDLWSQNDRTVILMADTIFSRAALGAILADQKPLRFAGSYTTAGGIVELFSLSFAPECQADVRHWLDEVPCHKERHAGVPDFQAGHLRNLLHVATGDKWRQPLTWYQPPECFLPITDWTKDIDTVEDIGRIPWIEWKIKEEEG
mgnify:CR=1 FL=1